MLDHILLCAAAFVAGAINSIAGGGTLITFPALVSVLGASAVQQVIANATNTVALCPGSATGAWAYRHDLGEARARLLWLLAPSLVGGVVGAILLIRLKPDVFLFLVPWLILFATLLFLFQPTIARWTGIGRPHSSPSATRVVGTLVFQFFVALYGGYFGAGIGILMLSALAMMGLSDIHQMNAVKTILATLINGIAVLVFIANDIFVVLAGRGFFESAGNQRTVNWEYALPMIVAGMIGGYASARVARSLNRNLVRRIVVAIGFCLAGYYFWQNWW